MHTHSHHHAPSYNQAFVIGVTLNLVFVGIEGLYGILANSLALVADAGHNLIDVVTLLLAWGATFLAAQQPTPQRTYGLQRVTILTSLLSATLLLLALGGITWEALGRLAEPTPIDGWTVVVIALAGVIVNTITALLFFSGQKHDLNIKAAYLHMAADALVSVGVVIAGILILFTGWLWLDPLISLVIVAVVFVVTWKLLKDSAHLAIDGVPAHIRFDDVETWLLELPGVESVHDLHIWGTSTTKVALTAHLIMPNKHPDDAFLSHIAHRLNMKFGIAHTTVQIEQSEKNACPLTTPKSL